MEYRVLVDENTSPRVAEALRGKGIEAEHVHEALSEGVDDDAIAAFAREAGYVVLTHDTDFSTGRREETFRSSTMPTTRSTPTRSPTASRKWWSGYRNRPTCRRS